jgi:hypothetical protein
MNQGSEVLEEVLLPIYSDDKCLHTMYEIDQKTQICAGSKGKKMSKLKSFEFIILLYYIK